MTDREYNIPPVPCQYKGINFRSTTEARWAVFFDYLGWDWIYEHDYYKLPIGYYLPDFFFPDIKAHGEVKPDEFTPLERKKCVELSELFPNTQVLQLCGVPSRHAVQIIENGAVLTYAIPINKSSKFYPFFYTELFNKIDFPVTFKAINFSADHIF